MVHPAARPEQGPDLARQLAAMSGLPLRPATVRDGPATGAALAITTASVRPLSRAISAASASVSAWSTAARRQLARS